MKGPLNNMTSDKKAAFRGLKVGFVFDDSLDSYDGVAQYVKTLGSWLDKEGHSVRYLVGQTKMQQWSGGKVYSLARNQRVVFNKNRLSIPLPTSRGRITAVLQQEKFDVLHVQVPYSPFMAQQVVQAADSSVAVIGTFHVLPANVVAKAGSHFLRLMYGKSLSRFDEIVSVSPAAAEFARKAFGIETPILPNVIDLSGYKELSKRVVKKNVPHIVFLGRLVDRKGCGLLLKAFARLHQKHPTAVLTIAGEGPELERLKRYTRQHALSEFVDFRGFVSENIKPALLASADIACFPSLYGESFGIVLLEAMASGAGIVLGGDNPGYRSVLGKKPQLLIDPRDTEALVGRLELLINDQALAGSLHKWQTAEIKQYDTAIVGQKLLGLYNQAIAKRGQGRHNKSYAFR
jgi:phosphatidyl-myo-inositol alpha-mannosyltransferase